MEEEWSEEEENWDEEAEENWDEESEEEEEL